MSFTAVATPGFTSVTAIAFDTDNPDQMWIAGVVGGMPALLFSTDGGVGFEARQTGLPGTPISDVLYDQPSGLLFAATTTGVFVSADLGLQFEQLGVGLDGAVAEIAHGPSQAIVAATDDGVFRLDLTPPPPIDPMLDAGVDAGDGGGGGGGGCCQTSSGSGAGSSALLALCVLIAFIGQGARRRRRRAGRTRPA